MPVAFEQGLPGRGSDGGQMGLLTLPSPPMLTSSPALPAMPSFPPVPETQSSAVASTRQRPSSWQTASAYPPQPSG